MPGPMSAPNGNYSLTNKPRSPGEIVKSGKTAFKKGKIDRSKAVDEVYRAKAGRKS